MSGPEDHIAELPEGDDLLAAEYVLGVLGALFRTTVRKAIGALSAR